MRRIKFVHELQIRRTENASLWVGVGILMFIYEILHKQDRHIDTERVEMKWNVISFKGDN